MNLKSIDHMSARPGVRVIETRAPRLTRRRSLLFPRQSSPKSSAIKRRSMRASSAAASTAAGCDALSLVEPSHKRANNIPSTGKVATLWM